MELLIEKVQKINFWYVLGGLIVTKAFISSLNIYDIFWVGGAILFHFNRRKINNCFKKILFGFELRLNKLLLMSKGFSIGLANKKEIEVIQKLRYDVYLEKGYINERKKKKLGEEEDYKQAESICIKKGEEIIASLRIIYSKSKKQRLPIEDYFHIIEELHPYKIEISKLVVDQRFRKKSFGSAIIVTSLLLFAWKRALDNGINIVYFFMDERLAMKLSRSMKIGFSEVVQGELSTKQLDARNEMAGYFQNSKIKPYKIKL